MIYLDHHATTPIDQVVLDAMWPWMTRQFGNPHSHTHEAGREAARGCQTALETLARLLGCDAELLTVTSGATESNNLALRGAMKHPRQKRRRIITVVTEHPSVIDPVKQLEREGYDVCWLPVQQQNDPDTNERCGQIDLDQLRAALTDDTALVSVMWANNEIGTLQPMSEIAALVHQAGALLHCDATQAVGRLPIDLESSGIDLLTASAHKFYGPKGVGLLATTSQRRVRLMPMIDGGGQQQGRRSGTLNVPGLIGMATALGATLGNLEEDRHRQRRLRDRLWQELTQRYEVELNGPELRDEIRLYNNLNFSFLDVEGETLMAAMPELCVSSGSACSSTDPRPSYVLTGIGLSESRARRSLRIGVGRFTTDQEVDQALDLIESAYQRVRA